jgi:hypothetical protein
MAKKEMAKRERVRPETKGDGNISIPFYDSLLFQVKGLTRCLIVISG